MWQLLLSHYAGPKEDLSSYQTRRGEQRAESTRVQLSTCEEVFPFYDKELKFDLSGVSLALGWNSDRTLCGGIFSHDNNAVTRSGSIIRGVNHNPGSQV